MGAKRSQCRCSHSRRSRNRWGIIIVIVVVVIVVVAAAICEVVVEAGSTCGNPGHHGIEA